MIHPEREDIYERAKQGYAKRFEEGFKANLTLAISRAKQTGPGVGTDRANQDPHLGKSRKNFWMKFLKRVSEQGSKQIPIQLH